MNITELLGQLVQCAGEARNSRKDCIYLREDIQGEANMVLKEDETVIF